MTPAPGAGGGGDVGGSSPRSAVRIPAGGCGMTRNCVDNCPGEENINRKQDYTIISRRMQILCAMLGSKDQRYDVCDLYTVYIHSCYSSP